MLTERDIQVILALVRYYVLNRGHIQRLCFPEDETGRITRRRLQGLVQGAFISRLRAQVHHPFTASPGPVYFPARRGCELLAEHFDDERYLAATTQAPQPHHLLHWLAVSDTHIALDAAIACQKAVVCEQWFNEWDTVNREESAPEKRFRLYLLLRESPRLVAAPDAAFLLSVAGHNKAFYLEQDRNTSGVRQIAASKTQGYTEMAKRGSHRRHFPTATVESFSVLMIAPTDRRRDALRKAIREKPGAELWKFAAAPDLRPDTFLHSPIFYPCAGDPMPLVKTDSVMPTPTPSIPALPTETDNSTQT